ncbi:DinB family protein [Paeniglutamicibacter psychrophenolicus]|uniref:Damage-inducible protein DinB n=1 Tax=Paeniglutamicibacter psychrophenolicus TaxID=257454 RepID=A0ABS4WGF5_9MICC|nr:DinB family protein [Paeniglutamicibacter psychrophenolicus]MBP2375272.1 putative damage-inducible protein DinB [Paeniglutamicibacter psychrophenolicus]
MAIFDSSDNLAGSRFNDADLHGSWFNGCDLSDATMRGGNMQGADIDDPWLLRDGGVLMVNGVDVVPFVRAELLRRFPGRATMRAADPEGLRAAWETVERAWASTMDRVAALPAGVVDESVDGEWSFSQTLRHLVMATDIWLRLTIEGIEAPFHHLGQPNDGFAEYGYDASVFTPGVPSFPEVLEARAGRVAMVRGFLATLTDEDLEEKHSNPWNPDREQSTRSCLHVILSEEWEHLRFAVRDLDTIEKRN